MFRKYNLIRFGLLVAITYSFLLLPFNFLHRKSKNVESVKVNMTKIKINIRILCLVLTSPANHERKAYKVFHSWGKRCTFIRFLTTQEDPVIPTIISPTEEIYDNLWLKTKLGFQKAYESYLQKVDWVLKADDDTFIIMENLHHLLSEYNPSEPMWFGCLLKAQRKDYMMGGAGYVLSKEAVIRLNEISLINGTRCGDENEKAEDVIMGNCLGNVGVKNMNSTDSNGRYLFLPFFPDTGIGKANWTSYGHWFWNYLEHKNRKGFDFSSDRVVSFHYVSPEMIEFLEYMIYGIKTSLYGL